MTQSIGKLFVVGIGPGGPSHLTPAAREAIVSSDTIVGYDTYLELVAPLLVGKEVVSSGMMQETERCREALRLAAAGRRVALVSSGDPGVYGMAGLALELAEGKPEPEIIIVPGVSAVQAAAAVLGAPLMHDFAVVSLSDLLTPWETIERRLQAAASADFVTALYNPRSIKRVRQLEEARRIFLEHRLPSTPVGIVRNACREGEERVVTTLEEMLAHKVDMFSLVIIGNSATYVDEAGRMITPRGYHFGTRDSGLGTRKSPGKIETEPLQGQEETRSDGSGEPEDLHSSRIANPESRSLMICGTASDVGKSVLAAAFCRILKRRGLRVAPFKSQNMALNSAVTPEGGEIGRAQAVQADACGISPHTDMNPVLLKPNSDTGSQVIVQGRVVGNMNVREYNAYKPIAWERVEESFRRLGESCDFVVIEGAGSIAEINLKRHDIANLKVARMAGAPVILVADIDRGGVFAQIVGTLELLEPAERAMVKGVIINRFRGDPSLLAPGIEFVEKRTGVPVLGVVPWLAAKLPQEDSVALQKRPAGTRDSGLGTGTDKIRIAVVKLPRISNYTDFDPLEAEPDVELEYLEGDVPLEGFDVVIIPGSKSTTADLLHLMERGLFQSIREFRGNVVGICGGFQMLGNRVLDPEGVESAVREAEGLSLLDAETVMLPEKELHQAGLRLSPGGLAVAPGVRDDLAGYEIHMGETRLGPGSRHFGTVILRSGKGVAVPDGGVSPDGRVFGTYLHGIFDNAVFRNAFLNRLREGKGMPVPGGTTAPTDPFDLLANHVEKNVDVERLLALCGIRQ
jgi:adenosylcobyric acid synthase